jgi:hypothetical protein
VLGVRLCGVCENAVIEEVLKVHVMAPLQPRRECARMEVSGAENKNKIKFKPYRTSIYNRKEGASTSSTDKTTTRHMAVAVIYWWHRTVTASF